MTQAEQEYRAALLLSPQNADLYLSLAYILDQQNKWDDADGGRPRSAAPEPQ